MQAPRSTLNKNGFTLMEVMVAMVIMLIGLLGLLQALVVASNNNAINLIRDEAVQVSDSWASWVKAKPFDLLSTTYTTKQVQGKIRKGVIFNVDISTSALGSNTKKIVVRSGWTSKGITRQAEVVSTKTRN